MNSMIYALLFLKKRCAARFNTFQHNFGLKALFQSLFDVSSIIFVYRNIIELKSLESYILYDIRRKKN